MNKLSKTLTGVIILLLLLVGFLSKYILDKKHLEEERVKENKEVLRLSEELENYGQENYINNLSNKDGVFYFEIDEGKNIDIKSDIFEKVVSTLFENNKITSHIVQFKKGEDIKFEYRFNYRFYPKLAILIDDVGMNTSVARKFVDLDMTLTYAVLPYLPKSKEAGDILREAGYLTILHMPMEGSNPNLNKKTDGLIYDYFDEKRIQKEFDAAYENVGEVKGFNNHMGSVFTSDEEKMEMLLRHTGKKGLFYVDSNTSRRTRGYYVAKQMGIPTVKCSHFIDNSKKVEDIEKEIEKSVQLAKDHKKVVVIGHYHNNLVEALKNKKEYIEANGVKLVNVGQLLE